MSPKKPVENLSVLSANSVVTIALELLKYSDENDLKEVKKYFAKLPRILRETVLLSILDLTALKSSIKWTTFDVFGSSCFRFTSTQVSPKYHGLFVEHLENVLNLNLTNAKVEERLIIGLVEKCPNLRSLVIPDLATDKILRYVQSLQNLKLLDISGKTEFSLTGLSCLSSKSLNVLRIGNSLTFLRVIGQMLPQLPYLKEIRTCELLGRALMELKYPYVSHLRSIKDCNTSREQMEVIVSVCPYLEELYLEDPDSDIMGLLEDLRELKKLKIIQFSRRLSNLVLKKLTLLSIELKNIPLNVHNMCVTVENLILTSCQICCQSIEDLCFRNLKIIELIDCNPCKKLILHLISHCDKLQRLVISNDIGLTDSDIKIICRQQKLKQLEDLWLSVAKNLTSDSVIMLMNHCDNLTLLGTLNGWNIDRSEVNYLRCITHLTNTNLNLLYFNCF